MSEGYNFTAPGPGTFDFEGDNTFYVVRENNEIGVVHANQKAAYTAAVVGNLAVARRDESVRGISKRATFVSCSSTQQTQLTTALASAETYASEAYKYLNSISASTTRYATWFGAYTTSRHSTVLSHFSKIDGNDFSTFTFDCSCTDSAYAYVYPAT